MALKDPVAIYTAASNYEAEIISIHLTNAGFEAFAVEDHSTVGLTWIGGGAIPEMHRPQVFVERTSAEAARKEIDVYEEQKQQGARTAAPEFCYRCGEQVERGTAACPGCGKPLDWSRDADEDEYEEQKSVSYLHSGEPFNFPLFFKSWAVLAAIVVAIVALQYFLS